MSQYAFYRTKAAITIDFIKPTFNEKGFLERHGTLYFQGAPSLGTQDRSYDWKKKVTFGISYEDLPALLEGFHVFKNTGRFVSKGKDCLEIYHDGAKAKKDTAPVAKNNKFFRLSNLQTEGTYGLSITEDGVNVSVPLGVGDLVMLDKLFLDSVLLISGVQ